MNSDRKGSGGVNGKTPLTPLNLDNKLNKFLKHDLDQLEKISMRATSGTYQPIRPTSSKKPTNLEPKRIDLNRKFIAETDKNSKPKDDKNQTLAPGELQHKLATRKYPFVNEEHVSIDELRNRVYHGTLGVYPVRQSQNFDELNIVMKGRAVQLQADRDYLMYYDEGIDNVSTNSEENYYSEQDKSKPHANLNTPATYNDYQALDSFRSSNTVLSSISDQQNDDDLPQILTLKPAILPQTGNTALAKMSERPKPIKKPRTHYSPPPMKQKAKQLHELQTKLISGRQMTEQELQQYELLKQVRGLVEEARQLTNLSSNASDSAKLKKKKSKIISVARSSSENVFARIATEDLDGDTINVDDIINEQTVSAENLALEEAALREQQLMHRVEDLVGAIKSGQLVKEQELSNKKIVDILSNVLDMESLKELGIVERDEYDSSGHHSLSTLDMQSSELMNQLKEESIGKKTTPNEELNQSSTYSLKDQLGSILKENSGQVVVEEDMAAIQENESRKKMRLSYEDEVDRYLASLPSEVGYEDVLNVKATQTKIFARANIDSDDESKKKVRDKPEVELKDKFAKNLHYFCMLEDERRGVLLLPDELKDVTRKYHTRDRYEHKRFKSAFSAQSSSSATTNRTFTSKEKPSGAHDKKRIINDLAQMFSQTPMNVDKKDYMDGNDSGVGESLDSWRVKAENAISSELGLDGKKMSIDRMENMAEFSLTFLRPAPPKMSIRPARVREHLFPEYYSMPPPVDDFKLDDDDENKSKKSSAIGKKFFKFSRSGGRTTEEDLIEDEDSDLEDEIFLEKLLNRQYHSETDLNEFPHSYNNDRKRSEFPNVRHSANKLIRTLSDSLLCTKRVTSLNHEDYEFLKISSNFNEAMEEVKKQKQIIKQEFLSRSKQKEIPEQIQNENTMGLDEEEESLIKNMEEYPKRESIHSKHVYFPKNETKTRAEKALEAGRKYVLLPEKTDKKRSRRRLGKRHKPMSFQALNEIEHSMKNDNIRSLARCESMDRIKFPIKIDLEVQVPNKHRLKKRPSVPDLFDFEQFKRVNKYEESEWHKTADPKFFNREKEWTRDIWSEWFDEVIPDLDGYGGRNGLKKSAKAASSSLSNYLTTSKMKKMEADLNTSHIEEPQASEEQAAADNSRSNSRASGRGEKKKQSQQRVIIKSPTPYDTFDQVNLEEVDPEMLKALETEIEVLTERIENRTTCFDLTRRGAIYRKLGFLKLAMDDVNKALRLERGFIDAYWQRHLIYLVQDKKLLALEDLNTILKMNRTHAGAYLSRADLYAETNDVNMAIVNYSNALKYNPTDYLAFFKRAKMYEQRGDFRMAMDDYLSATKLNPKMHEAWFKHGMNYFKNKNWHYAIVDFTELIKHNPAHQAKARLYRGKCYVHLGEFQQAFEDFCVAVHLNPNDWEAYYHRGCLLRKVEPMKALQDLSTSLLIEDSYENIKAYLHRGILYTDLERYDEAIKDFENALEMDKHFAPAYVNLGIIYMTLNMNYWKALRNFDLAIKSDPVYIRAYLCRAQAYREIHELKKAYLDYTRAIHLDPTNTQIYIYRGQVIFEMGNQDLAAFCVQHAAFITDKPRSSHGADSDMLNSGSKGNLATPNASNITGTVNQSVTQQALVFLFLKQFDKAIGVLEHELKIKPSSTVYNLLGRVFMKAKRWKEAASSYDSSIEANNNLKTNPRGHVLNAATLKLIEKETKKDMVEAYHMRGQCLIELYKYHEAYSSFDKVIALDPQNAHAYYYRGLTKVRLNQANAIQDFNKALAINPNLFEAFLARACIYGANSRYTKAVLNCNKAIQLSPKAVRGYLYRGALKYMCRSYKHAVEDLTDAIRLDQTCALAFFNRALSYQQLKEYKNALKDFSAVLMLGEYLEDKAYINRALLYFHLKDYYNSLLDFETAVKFHPEDYHIHHMIGVCLHRLRRYEEAIEKLTEAYDLNKSYLDALISRGNVYVDFGNTAGFTKAQRDYEHVLLKDSHNVDAHINLAYLYQITGRFKLAWEQFTLAQQLHPKTPAVYEGRSVVCLQMSDINAALKDINQALTIKKSAEIFVNRGVIYQYMADNVNAMRDYQSAILMDSSYGLAYYNSANVLLLHRQYEQALNYFNIVVDKCGMRDESTYQNRAIARAMCNDTAGAFRDLCEAIKHGKYTSHIFMNRALLLYKLENYELAEKDLNTAVELSPNDALLYKLRADCKAKLEKKEQAIQDYKLAVEIQFREEERKRYR